MNVTMDILLVLWAPYEFGCLLNKLHRFKNIRYNLRKVKFWLKIKQITFEDNVEWTRNILHQ